MARNIIPLGNGPIISTKGSPAPKLAMQVDTQIVGKDIRQQLTIDNEVVAQWLMKTKEEQVRKALIEMGWTPPKDESPTAEA